MIRSFMFRALSAASMVASIVGFSGSAHAGVGPGDDRMQSAPTAWWTYENVTADQITQSLKDNSARLTDFRIASRSPLRFNATMIANSGAYAIGNNWNWEYGLTQDQMNDFLRAHGARPITMQAYWTGSYWAYAFVSIANVGTDQKTWWSVAGNQADIEAAIKLHDARLTSLSSQVGAPLGNYVAVMVPNTGTDAYRWLRYYRIAASDLDSIIAPPDEAGPAVYSLVDASTNSDGTLNAILIEFGGMRSMFWEGSPNDTVAEALDIGARALFLTPFEHQDGSWSYYSALQNNKGGFWR